MWKISKSSRLRRREKNITARAAIDIGNTTEETMNFNETYLVPLEITNLLKIQKKSEFNWIS